jgi:DNA-binding IclR family transcriptional regulator
MSDGRERSPRGIQSVEVGGQLLLALAHQGQPMALKDLAREAGMTPAKAHPYLVSFGKLGLVEQEAGSGRYGLGPLALQLGMISLQQFDPVRLATPLIDELAQRVGHTVAIAVWGNRGPTIVRIAEAPSAVHVSMRHGTVMSVRSTASGRLFAAFLPRDKVLAALADDGTDGPRRPAGRSARSLIDAAFEAELAEVRQQRMSRAQGSAVQGVSALAAPVFDVRGTMVLSITAIGAGATFDARLDGPVAAALKRCAGDLSRRLGATTAS